MYAQRFHWTVWPWMGLAAWGWLGSDNPIFLSWLDEALAIVLSDPERWVSPCELAIAVMGLLSSSWQRKWCHTGVIVNWCCTEGRAFLTRVKKKTKKKNWDMAKKAMISNVMSRVAWGLQAILDQTAVLHLATVSSCDPYWNLKKLVMRMEDQQLVFDLMKQVLVHLISL